MGFSGITPGIMVGSLGNRLYSADGEGTGGKLIRITSKHWRFFDNTTLDP